MGSPFLAEPPPLASLGNSGREHACSRPGIVDVGLNPPGESADFRRELLAIANDPKVRGLARRRVGDYHLVEDVIQEALYAVIRIPDPERIVNLRAFFCTVVIHEAARLRSMPGLTLEHEPATAPQPRRGPGPGPAPRPLEDAAAT